MGIDLPWLNDIHRPARARRIPSVLTKDEVAGILACMEGQTALLARLLYGTGMRLMEGMRMRIKDVDFDRHVIIVREAKGNKDRVVMLPRALVVNLRMQLLRARAFWEADWQAQRGRRQPGRVHSAGLRWRWLLRCGKIHPCLRCHIWLDHHMEPGAYLREPRTPGWMAPQLSSSVARIPP